ncbi:MAG: hypothetical protein ABSA74_03500 [Candidatus Staskawiczbacteria bacterium]|jgi:hypothetical protein
MSKVLIAAIILIVVILAGIGVYYFVFFNRAPAPVAVKNNFLPVRKTNKIPAAKPITPEEQAAEIQKDYPQKIIGVINFLDTKTSYKATIKTDGGEIYTLWPPQPEAIYGSIGVKNGQRVSVQGKIDNQVNLEWATITPI